MHNLRWNISYNLRWNISKWTGIEPQTPPGSNPRPKNNGFRGRSEGYLMWATTTPPHQQQQHPHPTRSSTRSLWGPVLTPNIYANYKKSNTLWVCCRALQTHRYVNLWVYSALQQVLLFLLPMPALQDDTMRAAARPPCRKGSGPGGIDSKNPQKNPQKDPQWFWFFSKWHIYWLSIHCLSDSVSRRCLGVVLLLLQLCCCCYMHFWKPNNNNNNNSAVATCL